MPAKALTRKVTAKAFLPLDEPLLGEEEIRNLTECIRTGWISWQGGFVQRLEKAFAVYTGSRNAIAMSNGSDALVVALRALGVGAGDEVIVPALTFSATAFAASLIGATVRFVDSHPVSMTMDPAAFERAITPRTRVVIPVHLYGRPADMGAFAASARRRGIYIVEDAAEAAGAEYAGKKVGSLGDIGCFSFHNKLMASGEGGVITLQDDTLAERIRGYRCPAPENRTDLGEIAMNHRMSNLHAAVAVAQLDRLEDTVARKLRLAKIYDEALAGIRGLRLLPPPTGGRTVYWRYSVCVTPDFPLTRDEFVRRLNESGYGARAMFLPLHRHPYYRAHAQESYPVAESFGATGLDLPSSPKLSDDQIREVAAWASEIARTAG
jgi:perosamine synthetase